MFKRLKRLYQLSQKDPLFIEKLEKLTPQELNLIPSAGDGKAEFISAGTEEEYQEQVKADKGLKGIFGL